MMSILFVSTENSKPFDALTKEELKDHHAIDDHNEYSDVHVNDDVNDNDADDVDKVGYVDDHGHNDDDGDEYNQVDDDHDDDCADVNGVFNYYVDVSPCSQCSLDECPHSPHILNFDGNVFDHGDEMNHVHDNVVVEYDYYANGSPSHLRDSPSPIGCTNFDDDVEYDDACVCDDRFLHRVIPRTGPARRSCPGHSFIKIGMCTTCGSSLLNGVDEVNDFDI